jgi:hypothetical protein
MMAELVRFSMLFIFRSAAPSSLEHAAMPVPEKRSGAPRLSESTQKRVCS